MSSLTKPDNYIDTDTNKISVVGKFHAGLLKAFIACAYKLHHKLGYQDLVFDFSKCQKAYPRVMLPVCCIAREFHKSGVEIELILPENETQKKLFNNANWSSLIDFHNFDESNSHSALHIPATRFRNGQEQYLVVEKLTEKLFSSIDKEHREDLRYIGWILNEITDNVINHSQSITGGLVQLTNHRLRKKIELTVCDSGMGIPNSLRSGDFPNISDHDALNEVIKEGVTRNKSAGQGNGLFGTYSIAQKTFGSLKILSGYGLFEYVSSNSYSNWKREKIPFSGTLIDVEIGYENPINFKDVLVIKGKPFKPIDTLDLKYESDDKGKVAFKLVNETTLGFGSRVSGKAIRTKLHHILSNDMACKIDIDFSEVGIISSSFADEAFAKLCCEIGVTKFFRRINLDSDDDTITHLIDKAIEQRMETGLD